MCQIVADSSDGKKKPGRIKCCSNTVGSDVLKFFLFLLVRCESRRQPSTSKRSGPPWSTAGYRIIRWMRPAPLTRKPRSCLPPDTVRNQFGRHARCGLGTRLRWLHRRYERKDMMRYEKLLNFHPSIRSRPTSSSARLAVLRYLSSQPPLGETSSQPKKRSKMSDSSKT